MCPSYLTLHPSGFCWVRLQLGFIQCLTTPGLLMHPSLLAFSMAPAAHSLLKPCSGIKFSQGDFSGKGLGFTQEQTENGLSKCVCIERTTTSTVRAKKWQAEGLASGGSRRLGRWPCGGVIEGSVPSKPSSGSTRGGCLTRQEFTALLGTA